MIEYPAQGHVGQRHALVVLIPFIPISSLSTCIRNSTMGVEFLQPEPVSAKCVEVHSPLLTYIR